MLFDSCARLARLESKLHPQRDNLVTNIYNKEKRGFEEKISLRRKCQACHDIGFEHRKRANPTWI